MLHQIPQYDRDNHRAVLKDYIPEVEIGWIGIHQASAGSEHWTLGITVIPMREAEGHGHGKDRKDCMKQFRAAWEKFSADPARPTEFLQAKRRRF